MNNETKVNTNNPQTSPTDEKKVAVNTTEYVGSFATPYGRMFIERGGAHDHLAMRSSQLSGLLMAIHGDGLRHFQDLSDDNQDSILWMAHLLSAEIESMVEIHRTDICGGRA